MSSQEGSPNEGRAHRELALITPVQSNRGGRPLDAAGSFSDAESTNRSVPYPKIKHESDSESVTYTPFTNTKAGKDGRAKSTHPIEKNIGAVSESSPKIKEEPESEKKIVDSLPPLEKGLSGSFSSLTDLDPDHLQSSPVSFASKDDLEPLPYAHEPFPLSGPVADDFLALYDSLSSDSDKTDEQSLATATSKDTKNKATAKKAPVMSQPYPHHYYWPYHAMYPPHSYAPHPGYPPHPYAPHPYPPVPRSSGYYSRKPTQNANSKPKPVIKEVKDDDIICGRGGKVNNHPGNKRFRKFIHQHKLEYLNATKHDKPLLAMKILERVKPGRFLVQTTGGYFEADEDRAREKASQALREGAAKLRKEGYGSSNDPTGGLKFPPTIALPNERSCGEKYADCPNYCQDFEPPHKKVKTEEGESSAAPRPAPKVIVPNDAWDIEDDELPFQFPV